MLGANSVLELGSYLKGKGHETECVYDIVAAHIEREMYRTMLEQADDMSGDVYPHGAREVVAHHLTANNQQSRK